MKLRTVYLLVSTFILPLHHSFASEADTFTRRNEPLEDAAELVNVKANDSIQIAIEAANNKNEGCIEDNLYKELRLYFNNHMKGKLTIEIDKDNTIPKREITIPDSVYGNWTPWDGMGLGLKFMKKKKLTLAPVVRIGDIQMGTDKFEHLFGQGFFYFNTNYLKGKGPISALKMGVFKEKTFLGGNKLANGVFSYGDQAANFNGMRMWNHMLQLRDDVLGKEHNIGPYIKCESDKWVQVKEIDFRNYADDSLDEAINCSKFPSMSTVRKFTKNINELGYSCPIDKNRLNNLLVKYGPFARWMVNESGTGVVKYFSEIKSKK